MKLANFGKKIAQAFSDRSILRELIGKQVDRNTGTFALDTVGRELLTMLGKSLDDFN